MPERTHKVDARALGVRRGHRGRRLSIERNALDAVGAQWWHGLRRRLRLSLVPRRGSVAREVLDSVEQAVNVLIGDVTHDPCAHNARF